MGIAVFAGMLGVTLFGLFLTPVFYVVIGSLVERVAQRRAVDRAPLAAVAGGGACDHATFVRPAGVSGHGLVCCMALLALGCATRPAYAAPVVSAGGADAGVRTGVRAAVLRPALVAAVRGSGARATGSRGPGRQPRRPPGGGARRSGARDLPDVELDRYPVATVGRVGRRSRAGDSRLHRRAAADQHLSRRVRCVLGARPVRRRPLGRAVGAAPKRRASRRRSRTCA